MAAWLLVGSNGLHILAAPLPRPWALRGNLSRQDTMTERLAFGRALAAARKARNHSQAELGRRIGGVVQATISSWETGVTEPTPAQVFAMEETLGIESGQLSKHLGYLPVTGRTAPSNPRAADYIAADPSLEPWA